MWASMLVLLVELALDECSCRACAVSCKLWLSGTLFYAPLFSSPLPMLCLCEAAPSSVQPPPFLDMRPAANLALNCL